jgi:hypothetical protein
MDKIKLIAPEGATSASVEGVQYDVAEDGAVMVDPAHALQLYGFGYGNAPAETESAETESAETESAETESAETESAETESGKTKSGKTTKATKKAAE